MLMIHVYYLESYWKMTGHYTDWTSTMSASAHCRRSQRKLKEIQARKKGAKL